MIDVIVTGGNRGIGLGISNAYAQSGVNVAVLCRKEERGDQAAANSAMIPAEYTGPIPLTDFIAPGETAST